MTERLYYTDAYLTSFTAKVASVDGVRVQLDQTAFYPTSGGQQFDLGTLSGSKVVDVIDEDSGIVHVLSAPPSFAIGAEVTGTVDWTRRFDHMQQHTGQHLLSALFEDMAGAKTASVHFGAEYSTVDIEVEGLSKEKAMKIETRANAIVAENRAVTVSFEDAAAAKELRKPSDRTGDIRIVTINDIDRSACGGTHVRATGEIGAVLIRKLEKYKKSTRVEFICGARAIARARGDYEALSGMAASLSAGMDDLPKLVESQREQIKSLESATKALTIEVAESRAKKLIESNQPGPDGIRRINYSGSSMDEIRFTAGAIVEFEKVVFVGALRNPFMVLLAASPDSGVDAGAVLKPALAAQGGKGGGNAKSAQGTVPSKEALEAVIAAITGPAS